MKKVQYIGKSSPWTDRIYNTNLSFETGQSRDLPDNIAKKFLKHTDLFAEADTQDKQATQAKAEKQAETQDDTAQLLAEAEKAKTAQIEKQNNLADIVQEVNNMDKDGLEKFAKHHFQQNIDKRLAVDKLRKQVRTWIDEYGLV